MGRLPFRENSFRESLGSTGHSCCCLCGKSNAVDEDGHTCAGHRGNPNIGINDGGTIGHQQDVNNWMLDPKTSHEPYMQVSKAQRCPWAFLKEDQILNDTIQCQRGQRDLVMEAIPYYDSMAEVNDSFMLDLGRYYDATNRHTTSIEAEPPNVIPAWFGQAQRLHPTIRK